MSQMTTVTICQREQRKWVFVCVCVGRLSIIYRQFGGVSFDEQCSIGEQGFSSCAGKIAAFCLCWPDSFTATPRAPASALQSPKIRNTVVVERPPPKTFSLSLWEKVPHSGFSTRTTPGIPLVRKHTQTHTQRPQAPAATDPELTPRIGHRKRE